MRKTIKKTIQEEDNDDDSVVDNFETASNGMGYSRPENTIEKSYLANEARASRVNELLNKMDSLHVDNVGAKLADFKPPPSPELTAQRKESSSNDHFTPEITSPDELLPQNAMMPPVPTFFHQAPKNRIPVKSVDYGANDMGLSRFSNYNQAYEPPRLVQPTVNSNSPYYAKMGIGAVAGSDDKLMEKLNYMIHLLEQQQHEKTDNVLEEFILYSFLGVFVIFMSDSFVRAGKYVR